MQGEEFEWDPDKARSNLAKHGVSFEAARLVFDDVFALDRFDAGSGHSEARYIITGVVNGILVTVVYTERGERTRIISARKATRYEQREYYDSQTAE
jgi:uncharacterized DUF497 family protein